MNEKIYITIATIILLLGMLARCWVNWKRTGGIFWETYWKTAFDGMKALGGLVAVIGVIGTVVLLVMGKMSGAVAQAIMFIYGMLFMVVWSLLVSLISCAIVFPARWMLKGKPNAPPPIPR
jgi:hypothetical protein